MHWRERETHTQRERETGGGGVSEERVVWNSTKKQSPLRNFLSHTHLQLVDVVLAREDGLPSKELGENAAARPQIDRHRVVILAQHDLRGAVPARHDVLRQVLRRAVVDATREAKVADLQVAVAVQEKI